MVKRADIWLTAKDSLKLEVDVLKSALRAIKAGKSVDFNLQAGIKRIEKAARLLTLTVTASKELIETWKWLTKNRKLRTTASYKKKEADLFKSLKSPLTRLAEKYPGSEAENWLRNSPAQVIDVFYKAADVEFPAAQVYAYASAEGLIDEYVREQIGLAKTEFPTKKQMEKVKIDEPVEGFIVLGTDDFFSEFGAHRQPLGKLLPKSFDLSKVTERRAENEEGRIVRSAKFPDLLTAITGMIAVLKRRRKLFIEDAAHFGYRTPTTEELVYWTAVYYNSGESAGRKRLGDFKGKRTLSDWIKKGVDQNAMKRLQSYKMLVAMKIL